MPQDRDRAARAIEEFLRALGHDPEGDDDLRETGQRVADAWIDDLLEGERIDARALLEAESFAVGVGVGVVLLRDVEVATVCPHHLMPAMGTALIAYAPGERVAGLGTLKRVLDACSRRMTLQERIGQEFVELVMGGLKARGAACQLKLKHACLSARSPPLWGVGRDPGDCWLAGPGGELHGVLLRG